MTNEYKGFVERAAEWLVERPSRIATTGLAAIALSCAMAGLFDGGFPENKEQFATRALGYPNCFYKNDEPRSDKLKE